MVGGNTHTHKLAKKLPPPRGGRVFGWPLGELVSQQVSRGVHRKQLGRTRYCKIQALLQTPCNFQNVLLAKASTEIKCGPRDSEKRVRVGAGKQPRQGLDLELVLEVGRSEGPW